jgi:hypothetical protein
MAESDEDDRHEGELEVGYGKEGEDYSTVVRSTLTLRTQPRHARVALVLNHLHAYYIHSRLSRIFSPVLCSPCVLLLSACIYFLAHI